MSTSSPTAVCEAVEPVCLEPRDLPSSKPISSKVGIREAVVGRESGFAVFSASFPRLRAEITPLRLRCGYKA